MKKKETDAQRVKRMNDAKEAKRLTEAARPEQAAHNAAFGYVRVSSEEQLKGDGPERQEQKIYAHGMTHNIKILEYFTDATKGKNELKYRKEMTRMMAKLEAFGVKTVIVENPDRLARDTIVSEMLIERFQKLGVKLVSADGNVELTAGDARNPTAKLVRIILGAVAELNKNLAVNRMWSARERIRSTGVKCEGGPGYGELKGEWPIVERMYAMRAAGMSYRAITRELNATVLPRRGHYWYARTVILIMARIDKQGKAPTPGPTVVKYAEARAQEAIEAEAKRIARLHKGVLVGVEGIGTPAVIPVPPQPPESTSPIQN